MSDRPPRPFRVGLLGCGTVGAAFAELMADRADAIAAGSGLRLESAGVLTRSTGDFDEILEASDLVVELIGGIEPARTWVLRSLDSGRHVVTANKQLVSAHGDELFAAARKRGVQLRFEAAVGGVVPVVRVMQETLAGAHIERVSGIVNGTTNFILSEMARSHAEYATCLAKAQELGYAEADPTDDVTGKDAAAKMAILARLAFHAPVGLDRVEYEGIESVKPDDLAYAREFGLSLKLLAVAERVYGIDGEIGITARVFPCFLYGDHPLASIDGPFNAVTIESPSIREITLSGPGAGGPETASAVLGDVVSAMTGTIRFLEQTQPLQWVPGSAVRSSFYLHLEVPDRPGVLARIAECLGRNGISVKSAVQKGHADNATLVLVLHAVREEAFFTALAQIGDLGLLRSPPRALRVLSEDWK